MNENEKKLTEEVREKISLSQRMNVIKREVVQENKRWWFKFVAVPIALLCLIIIAASYLSYFTWKHSQETEKRFKSQLREIALKAEASLRAAADINYFSNIILTIDEITNHSLSHNEVTEVAFMIYSFDRRMSPLCGYDAAICIAQILKESHGNIYAVSRTADRGLWQLHDPTGKRLFRQLGFGVSNYYKDVYDPIKNTRAALFHIEKELYPYWTNPVQDHRGRIIREAIRDKNLLLFLMVHSYRWGTEATELLRTSYFRKDMPGAAYTMDIINRAVEIRKELKKKELKL
jgi:hypothetical protein